MTKVETVFSDKNSRDARWRINLRRLPFKLTRYRIGFLLASSSVFVLLAFQNCSQVGFDAGSALAGAMNTGGTMTSVTASTKKGKPVTFSAGTINGSFLGNLSFAQNTGQLQLSTANGTFKVLDPTNFLIEYTPNDDFVGTDEITVYATSGPSVYIPGHVKVIVGNILNLLQPALAVRGMSCITCHSSVASNVITDYGYGSSWYFDTASSDSFYADRLNDPTTHEANGLATLSLLNSSKIFVPANAPSPAAIQSLYPGDNTLAKFIAARFTEGGITPASAVSEVASLKINLPTAARIRAVFNNPAGVSSYIKDTQNSPDLSGLVYDSVHNAFQVSNLVCDGDLYLSAPVIFDSATVQSVNGCRIYSTASIFIQGPLISSGYQGSANYNTQLLSSESIWLGGGKMSSGGAFCDTDASNHAIGWYTSGNGVDCSSSTYLNDARCDSLLNRAYQMQIRNTYSNNYSTAAAMSQVFNVQVFGASGDGTVAVEKKQVEASLGHSLLDASCGSQKRNIAFSRLLLAAPYVNSRYYGDFSGAIISDAALMSLGTFKFSFDPIFKTVSTFSLLDQNELISGSL